MSAIQSSQTALHFSDASVFFIGVFCGKPRLRDFVNVVRISGTSYFYGDKIKFRCRAGVQPARYPPEVTCTEDGSWDGEIRCGGKQSFRH